MRVLAIAVLVCGCSSNSNTSSPDGAPVEPDAGVDGPSAPTRGSCGQAAYDWLETASMGDVVAVDSHSPLTEAGAQLVRAALIANDVSWTRGVRHETRLHELRYVTQDRGEAIEATGYVIVPDAGDGVELPVVLSLHGTSGVSDGCAPSRNLDDSSSDNYAYALVLSLIAANGYIVVAPDYIGMKASGDPSPELSPYLVGEATAIASWDAVRAAKKHIATLDGAPAAGPVAVWGASQGGHAAAFTIRYAPLYAPEIDVVAGVYNVPPLALDRHWQRALTTASAGTGFMVLAHTAMAEWYQTGGLSDVFNAPLDTALPADLRQNCSPTAVDGIETVEDLFTSELLAANAELDFGGLEPWGCIARENSIPGTSIERADAVPSLVVTGGADTLVPAEAVRDTFTELCASGEYDDWRYLECDGAGHAEGFLWAVNNALDFIDDRVSGQPLAGACQITAPRVCANTP